MAKNPYASLKQGLVGAWIPSLGASGFRLIDRSGYGNHGSLQNMDAASDWIVSGGGLALDFDGVDDYVAANPVNAWNSSTRGCIAYWMSKNSSSSDMIVGSRISSSNGIWLQWYSDGNVYFSTRNGSFSSISVALSFNSNWMHLAATWDNTAGAIYINGISVATGAIDNPSSTSANDFRIGAVSGGFQATGKIDDVRCYNRALTPSEIKLLSSERGIGFKPSSRTSSHFAKRYSYNFPKEKNYSVTVKKSEPDYASLRQGLVGAWCPSVSGASGYRAVDLSGYGNHGTLTNMDVASDWVTSGGLALDFDGVDDNVVINNNPWLNNQTGAISAWVRFSGTGSGGARSPLVSLGETSGPAVVVCALRKQDTKNVFQYRIINSTTSVNNEVDGSTVISNGVWYHVVVTSTGSSYSLMVNGVEESLTLANGANNGDWIGDLNLSTTTQRLGSQFFQGSLFSASNCQLDDIRIYNRALTPAEIKLLASKRGIGLQPRPRHYTYYQFPSGNRRRILTGQT